MQNKLSVEPLMIDVDEALRPEKYADNKGQHSGRASPLLCVLHLRIR
jgi:hypothetical protein